MKKRMFYSCFLYPGYQGSRDHLNYAVYRRNSDDEQDSTLVAVHADQKLASEHATLLNDTVGAPFGMSVEVYQFAQAHLVHLVVAAGKPPLLPDAGPDFIPRDIPVLSWTFRTREDRDDALSRVNRNTPYEAVPEVRRYGVATPDPDFEHDVDHQAP